MKIYDFKANLPPKVGDSGRSKAPADTGSDFEAALKAASGRPAGASSPAGAVSQENCRALQLPPLSELGMAGRLLNQLGADIRAASPEILKSVHNLEGLIYVYNKNSI